MKNAILVALETLDSVLGHPFGCGLLNNRMHIWYRESTDDFALELPSPTGRLYQWVMKKYQGWE